MIHTVELGSDLINQQVPQLKVLMKAEDLEGAVVGVEDKVFPCK
jgi:hypothetical protein